MSRSCHIGIRIKACSFAASGLLSVSEWNGGTENQFLQKAGHALLQGKRNAGSLRTAFQRAEGVGEMNRAGMQQRIVEGMELAE